MCLRAFVPLLRFAFTLTIFTWLGLSVARADQYYNSAEQGCDGTDPTVLFCDDLEDGIWAATNGDTNGGRANPDNDGWSMNIYTSWPDPQGSGWARCGSKGAAGTGCAGTSKFLDPGAPYPNGGVSSGMMGKHYFAPSSTQYEELYVRYYLKQLPGFIMGHEKTLTFQNQSGYQCCIMNKKFGSGALSMDSFYDSGWLDQNQGADISFQNNKWYYIEVHLKLNSPGSSDGLFEVWIDDCGTDGLGCSGPGTLRTRYTDRKFRDSASQKIEVTWFENWGNAGSTGEQYYDQFYVATRRVGPMAVGASTAPPAPTGLRVY